MNNFINKVTQLYQAARAVLLCLCAYLLVAGPLAAGVWVIILMHWFACDITGVWHSTLALWDEVPREWRVIAWLCVVVGALGAGCGFIWYLRGDRLPRGDQHYRGARIVQRDEQ